MASNPFTMRGSVVIESPNGLPTTSFWECKEYHRTVKRVDTANKMCSNLAWLINERAQLERNYSSQLKLWSQQAVKFSNLEYGTNASLLWKGLCKEAEAIANAHESIREMLLGEIHAHVKQWQKEHFHKSSLPPHTLKQAKQLEHEFDQVQKPWAKRLKKVQQFKKEYHHACQCERSLQVQVQNAKTDPAGTPDQLKKIQDKLGKVEKEMDRAKSVYTSALNDLDQDKPRYLEEMTRVFNTSQDLERERLAFFKTVFADIGRALNVTTKNDFNAIYGNLDQSISSCDIDADLQWWSANHGVDMPAVFPQFEEYSPELGTIGTKRRSQTVESTSGVTVTAVNSAIQEAPSETAETPTDSNVTNGPERNSGATVIYSRYTTPTPFDEPSPPSAHTTVAQTEAVDEPSDPAADYYASATYDDGRPGVPVRALYDYIGQEDDELTIVAGDVFEKLGEPDDNGWCKGRRNGRAGLYPAKYVEPI